MSSNGKRARMIRNRRRNQEAANARKRWERRSRNLRVEKFEDRMLLAASVLYSENFNSVDLGQEVDEAPSDLFIPDAWTHTPPTGWSIVNDLPGEGPDDGIGYTEWEGWSFANKEEFWGIITDDQDRQMFTGGSGTVAVADPDEWDDQGSPEDLGTYNTFLTTPDVELPGSGVIDANSTYISFNSSWRPEDNQTAYITASFSLDGGATFESPIEILRWESDSGSANFHDDAPNEKIEFLPLQNPTDATHVKLEFAMVDAGNDWWWAIDNISLSAGEVVAPGAATSHGGEDFEGVTLGDSIDEVDPNFGFTYPNSYTDTPPSGWSTDDSGVPGLGAGDDVGTTEWEGVAFVTKEFWYLSSDSDPIRGEFTGIGDQGKIAVFDPDQWNDIGDPSSLGTYNASMTSTTYDLTSAKDALAQNAGHVAQLQFDTAWKPGGGQIATIEASFDGGAWTEISKWTSDSADADYKPLAANEVAAIDLGDISGATDVQFRFAVAEATDDSYWALDNIEIVTRAPGIDPTPFFTEDFEGLPLEPPVDEEGGGEGPIDNVWTATPPDGVSVDNSGMGTGGITEFTGWTFMDPQWYDYTAGDQNRSQFMKGDEVIAVADGDEWDDSGPTGTFNSWMQFPQIDLTGVADNTVKLTFDSSWRDDSPQKAIIEVSYDGGSTWAEKLRWESDDPPSAGEFHDDEEDETVTVAFDNVGASTLDFRFGYIDAGNDWWWAVDNIVVTGDMTADARTWDAAAGAASWNDEASWSGSGTPQSDWEATLANGDAAAGKTAVVDADSDLGAVTVSGTAGMMELQIGEGVELGTTGVELGAMGYLTGSGQLVGDVSFSGGTIAPGTSAGNLDIVGSIGANGTYDLELGSVSTIELGAYAGSMENGDLIDVTGAIDLTGTETLNLSFDGTAIPAGIYVLMYASEGVEGEFETITDLGVYDDGTYEDGTLGEVPGGVSIQQLSELGLPLSNATDEPISVVVITITSDVPEGEADVMTDDIIGRVESNGDWYVARYDGTGFVNDKWNTWSTAVTWDQVVYGDFDGDDHADVAGRSASNGAWYVAASTGGSFTNPKWGVWSPNVPWSNVLVGDFNGDGMDDIAGQGGTDGNWYVASSTGTSFETSKWTRWSPDVTWLDVQTGDFNGDGNTDIVGRVASDGDWYVGTSTGTSFSNAKWTRWSPSVDWTHVTTGDFNGDGLTDLVGRVASSGDWYVGASTGSSFSNAKWTSWSTSVDWTDVSTGDFNADGLTDLVGRVASSGDWWVASSTGSSFSNAKWTRWSTSVDWTDVQVGDFDGDGYSDIAGRVSTSGDWWVAKSDGDSFANAKWGRWSTAVDWLDVQVGDYDGAAVGGGAGGALSAADDFWSKVGEQDDDSDSSDLLHDDLVDQLSI
jgi:hypothetical protein